jgi:ADP-heptose:LPS heptosyltransferase
VKAASSYQVLGGSGLIDDYAQYRTPRTIADVGYLYRQVRRLRPRCVYYLMPQRTPMQRMRDRIFFALCGVPEVRGLAISGQFDVRRPAPASERWESESMRLLRMVGGTEQELRPEAFSLRLDAAERERARSAILPLGGAPYLVLSLGTKLAVNDWGDRNWSQVLEALGAQLPGTGLALIGSRDESARCDAVSRAWPGPIVNLCGALNPRESGAVAEGALAFAGHDSGPAHLAAAVGSKVVAVYSARNLPGVWFPFGSESNVFYERTSCANCGLEQCVTEKMRCIRHFAPEQVVAKLRAVIAEAQ